MYSYVERKAIRDKVLKERLELVGPILKEAGIDGWLVMGREYNEDVVFPFLTPASYPTARRITMLLLTHENGQTKPYSLSLPDEDLEKYYVRAYDYRNEDQFDALKNLIEKLDLRTIAIDYSENFAFSDGLSAGLYRLLLNKLPKDITDRFVSADPIAIPVLEIRTRTEMEVYPHVMAVAMSVIDEAFSDATIKPGKTTCRDVMDFMDSKVNSLGLSCWFPSHINLQRKGGDILEEDTVIEKGDLVRCDFGITYLGLCTDTQRLCYILKDNEDELPAGLKKAMAKNNRFQDIVGECMEVGKTGNQVFLEAIEKGNAEGLRPCLYTHSLGTHGHAAGPMFGLYSNQNPIPVKGDLKLHDNSSYALELYTKDYVEEFASDIRIQTEESIIFKNNEIFFLDRNRNVIKAIRGGK